MTEFKAKSLCILGRQPQLGLAELESLYGAENVKILRGAALLSLAAEEINFQRLGGTIKTARILTQLPYTDWARLVKYLEDNTPQHLRHLPEGKFTLGLSVYGLDISPAEINRTTLKLKKVIKKSGRPVRVVPNKTQALSSAQVLHNKLTHKGAWELVFITDGQQTILAQTIFVQDIEAYAGRDQARPARDPRVGMLPPKLAQIIINLAMGDRESKNPDVPPGRYLVLDPFCGSGVVLQEALLMGYRVVGTDISPKMVDYAKQNLRKKNQKYPDIQGSVYIEIGDATTHRWQMFSTIASEVYLGKPFSSLPAPEKLMQVVVELNSIIKKFLLNLHAQLRDKQGLCLALPAWQTKPGKFKKLPVLAKLTDVGYNIKKFKHVESDDLIYYREGQIVARQLIVLEKSNE